MWIETDEEREERIARMEVTDYLCPECEVAKMRASYLRRDGWKYFCPQCTTRFSNAELADEYQGMYDGLIADAELVALRLGQIKAENPAKRAA